MQVPQRKSEQLRRAGQAADDFLTAEAVRRLKEELEDLEKKQRPHALEDLTRAREMGDLSENAAYTEAKGRVARIDGRRYAIEDKLKRAVVIEPGTDVSGQIRLGSTVVIETDGQRRTYQIVGAQEAAPNAGRISHVSPLGAALLNLKAGETAIVKAPNREIRHLIIEVK